MQSQNYPSVYPNYVNTWWRATVSHGNLISFDVEDFEFETGYDWLAIWDCNGALLWYSGHSSWNSQRYFTTQTHCAELWMYTDYSIQKRGFSLQMWAESKSIVLLTLCLLEEKSTNNNPAFVHIVCQPIKGAYK